MKKRALSVSVIVPTYNEEKLIGRTLKNLRKITRKGTEIIVCDGHSKDNTMRIARKHARAIMERGHSIGAGRNTGAEESNGSILWFVDADTFPTKEFYEKMMETFEEGEEVVCIGCHIMPENASLHRKVFFHFLNLIVAATVAVGKASVAGSCVAYRRSAFEKLHGFDTETASAEDMGLSQRVASVGKVVFLYHVVVPTSDRRVCQLGLLGLIKDWTRTTVWFLAGKKTASYFAPR